ncbi:MAG: prepilin peptidase, partial [Endomicrobia bacterium]|nr:prepilin peptidase [Endomicrobiia bacterium]
LFPSSFFPSCNNKIKWYDNIPLISYILLKGRCRMCKKPISFVYPVVELLCGILAMVSFLKFKDFSSIVFFNLFFILTVISIIDINTTEIPDVLSYYLIVSGILFSTGNQMLGAEIFVRIANSLLGGITGFVLFFLILFFGEKIWKKPVLGGGDVKLMCGIGCYVGIYMIFKILFIASLLATLYIMFLSIVKKQTLWGQYLQFAPFISLATFVIVFIPI